METTEKQAIMENLAARYDMTFLDLHTFDRWEQFAVGLNQESLAELGYLFREWEIELNPTKLIGENMAPVRQTSVCPMLIVWA